MAIIGPVSFSAVFTPLVYGTILTCPNYYSNLCVGDKRAVLRVISVDVC